MKPRLKAAPLTYDDLKIRFQVDARFLCLISPRPLPEWPSFSWILSDRRDADLMLHAQQIAQFGPSAITLHGIDVRGTDERLPMKPRLESLPVTEEDLDIWWWGAVHHRRPFEVSKALAAVYVAADRRDADLMYAWSQGWPIDLGGDDENGECLFWGDPPIPLPEQV